MNTKPKQRAYSITTRDYTVIGYYRDNNQPWMAHESAPDPQAAAGKALARLTAQSSGDPAVVEVIVGRHKGVLCNESLVMFQEGVMTEIGES
jgi:hypothetical protein